MITIRICFTLFLISSVLVPNVFSQFTIENNFSGEITYSSIPHNYKKKDDKLQYYENEEYNELIKFHKLESNTVSLIDSVIANGKMVV